ncbi:MAG: linear amide C-N hydrolase [Deltaproteobacteria bacterium]|nr:linear amide C-N hydrolase [Deltaproteobacteria bacterium]
MRTFFAATICLTLLTALPDGTARACTSFCQETPHGPVMAANLDLLVPADGLVFVNRRGIAKENFREGIDGRKRKWTSLYGSVTFNVAGRGFAWSGMNEVGLVVSSAEDRSSEYPEPDNRAPFDLGSWIQYVLDNFATVQEAILVDDSVRPVTDGDSPSHFLIADAKGDSAALDYVDGKLVVYTDKSLPVTAMSNMSYGRALEALKRGGPRWWWSNPGRSAERFATAASRMASFPGDSDTNEIEYVFHTLGQVADQYTQWSVGYHIGKRKIWFRTTKSPAAKYFSLDDFDFSCEAPLLMLDVHTNARDDVGASFTPYDHDVNLKVFTTTCARLGIQVAHDDAVDLMRIFDEFECAR